MIDSLTAMTTISVALKRIDQFRELALRVSGVTPQPPSGVVEQVGDAIQIRISGIVVEEVKPENMHLDNWDTVRYRALDTRVSLSWSLYNELYAQMPLLGGAELARVKITMDNNKRELCTDFREMVSIYERTLGTSIPDHYKLYEVCN